MENNQPPPQPNTPNPTPPSSPPNSTPSSETPKFAPLPPLLGDNSESDEKPPMNKYVMVGLVAGGFLIAFVVIVTIIAAVTKKPAKQAANPNQLTKDKPASELETIIAKDIYIDKIKYDLSITTPHGWGTQQNNNVIAGVYPWEGAKFLTSYRFRDANFNVNARTTSANNYIALQDITPWLVTGSNNYPLSAFDKRNNFDIIGSLGGADIASAEVMNKIINPRSKSEIAGRIKPEIVKSSNGSVSGVAYLTVTGASPVYVPRMILLMAGTVNNRQVYIYGDMAFTDPLKVKLDQAKAESSPDYAAENAAAFNDLKAGKLTGELQKFYEDALVAFKSIKLERTNTDNLIK